MTTYEPPTRQAIAGALSRNQWSPTTWDRLMARVTLTESCWLWNGSEHRGYGMIFTGPGRRPSFVHRVAWEVMRGPIPPGLHIDHLCRVRSCLNPEHLEPVTSGENTRRGMSPSLSRNGDLCRNGKHPWPEGAMVGSDGALRCEACWRAASNRNNRLRPCPHCGREMRTRSVARHVRRMHEGVSA